MLHEAEIGGEIPYRTVSAQGTQRKWSYECSGTEQGNRATYEVFREMSGEICHRYSL